MNLAEFLTKLSRLQFIDVQTEGNSKIFIASNGFKVLTSVDIQSDAELPTQVVIRVAANERVFFSWGAESYRDNKNMVDWYFNTLKIVRRKQDSIEKSNAVNSKAIWDNL